LRSSIQAAVLGNVTDDRQRAVRRGNKESSQQNHAYTRCDTTHREGFQQVEQLGLSGLNDDGTSSLYQVDCGATEDGEPNGGHTSWHQQNTDAEFANATAEGNTCQEHAYEREPRNPP